MHYIYLFVYLTLKIHIKVPKYLTIDQHLFYSHVIIKFIILSVFKFSMFILGPGFNYWAVP